MPEHLRSLVVILVLATLVFAFAKRPAVALAIMTSDFARRRNLWLAISSIAFLAQNFWIYLVAVGSLLLIAARREKNIVGLYLFLLFAVPPISAEITGLGIIRYFFAIDYLRLLALTILLPAAFLLRKQNAAGETRTANAEKFLGAYIILNLLLQLNVDSFTNTLRQGFYFTIDIILPYYVASRSLKDLQGFRDALMSIAIAGMVLAILGIFEFVSHYLLYTPLKFALGVPWGYSNYLYRDGILRAIASTGQPIILGYVITVAIGSQLFLKRSVPNRAAWWVGLALLVGGLIAPMSRGPWIGAAVMSLAFICSGPKALSKVSRLALACVVASPLLLFTSAGEKIISFLPFVGTVEVDNVEFRQQLIDLSVDIILANPLFGSYDYMLYLEELRHGQVVIDLVNSYLAIALSSGLVGLSFFAAFFGAILIGVFRGMRSLPRDDERHLLGRTLIATMGGILFTIFTVSSINVIPAVYWTFAGLGMAYIRLLTNATPSVVSRNYRNMSNVCNL